MKVQQVIGRSGRAVANQFIISDPENGVKYFQSYNSIIARLGDGHIVLDATYWDYSRTTAKYRNMFLGETTQEIKKKIADGTYTLADLNEGK